MLSNTLCLACSSASDPKNRGSSWAASTIFGCRGGNHKNQIGASDVSSRISLKVASILIWLCEPLIEMP